MKMTKILLPLLAFLILLPHLQAKREKLKKVLVHQNDGEELDFEEGYVASLSQQNDGGKEDIDFDEGYVVGLSEGGEAFSDENPFYQFNQLSVGSDTTGCVNCRIYVCKVRLVFKDKCIVIFGKKICIKVPVLEKYDCKYITKFCIPEALCKIIGKII